MFTSAHKSVRLGGNGPAGTDGFLRLLNQTAAIKTDGNDQKQERVMRKTDQDGQKEKRIPRVSEMFQAFKLQ